MIKTTYEPRIIRPQPGFQEAFLGSSADIVIGGGSAGGGKTFALLLESLRHINNPKFGFVCFRRTSPEIKNEGGLRDTSSDIYTPLGATPKESILEREFPSGAKGKFSHLEREKDRFKRQGSQIPLIMFDEVTHFTSKQFRYLVGRNRSTCGVKPYIRCTCNPDPDSRVAELISWRIGPDGYPIPERSGVIRYFVRSNDEVLRGDNKEDLYNEYPHLFNEDNYENEIKSLTFIPGSIYENKILLQADPGYLANLKSQDEFERAKLLEGNRKMRIDGLGLYNYDKISDVFSNLIKEEGRKCITCDVARFGSDLAVIMTWIGWRCIRVDIRHKSSIETLHQVIEDRRREYSIGSSDVLCDEDGVGGGLVDKGYKGFKNGDSPINKENYKDLKTQCYYKLGDYINNNTIHITTDNMYVDGTRTKQIILKGKTYLIIDLLKKQLLSIKRKDTDKDGKLQINDKAEQKAILGGLSPDLADTCMMRVWFDLMPQHNLYIFDN